jgi:bifunctional non-homologous end joining protein LigD
MQVYVPLNTAVTYGETKAFAHAMARLLERQNPTLVVSDMKKALRVGKVFVDWSQNDDHKTTICVYSLRARERPTVSTPLKWEEVENCLKKGDAKLLVFESDQVLERAKKFGDLFEPVLKLRQKLPKLEALQQWQGGAETQPITVKGGATARSEPIQGGAKRRKQGKSTTRTRSAASEKALQEAMNA